MASPSVPWPWPANLTVWQAMALSLLMFTGGSQFAFIGVIAGGGAGSAALGAAALLGVLQRGVRHAAERHARPHRLAQTGGRAAHHRRIRCHGLRATAPDEQQRGFWTAGVGVFVLWNLFTCSVPCW